MTIRPVFAWYDLWVGVYWSRKDRRLYILPVPCIGIVVSFPLPRPQARTPDDRSKAILRRTVRELDFDVGESGA